MTGQDAYEYRLSWGCSWREVAKAVGYSDARGARRAAKKYAIKSSLPYPLSRITKGASIYHSRKVGMSWASIANQYGDTISYVKHLGYKWAIRHGKPWEPV